MPPELESDMAERKWIKDLRTGDDVEAVFLLAHKELRESRKGSLYINGDVMDRSGTMPKRKWDATEALFESVAVQDFVRIKGRVESYKDTLQLIVKVIEKVPEDTVCVSDFMPTTDQDVDKMEQGLRKVLRTVEEPKLLELLAEFFNDSDFMAKFRQCPAAVQFHHAYLGGLLEHTLSLAKLAVRVLPDYPALRKDLLLVGVFLHDIGKARELSWDRGFTYTDEGELVGHIVLGVAMLDEKARQVEDFPPPLLDSLKHLVLSHHGQYEFGSPKLPCTAEATALHYLDNLDAKMHAFHKAVQTDRDPESDWTEYSRMFGRRLYKR